MQCFFHGLTINNDPLAKSEGTVSFAVPDIGVIFRSRWRGSLYECQYAALLSLLRFIENNDKLFKGHGIEIFSDAPVVVYQLTKSAPVVKALKPYYQAVQNYRSKFAFKIKWIPEVDNPACHGLNNVPSFKPSVEINYDIKEGGQKQIRRGGVLPL